MKCSLKVQDHEYRYRSLDRQNTSVDVFCLKQLCFAALNPPPILKNSLAADRTVMSVMNFPKIIRCESCGVRFDVVERKVPKSLTIICLPFSAEIFQLVF